MRLQHTRGERNGAVFLILIFAVLVALMVVVSLSIRTDVIDETLKNNSVIKVLFVMEDRGQVLASDILFYYPFSKRGALINILGNTGAIWQTLGRVDRIDAVFSEQGIAAYRQEIESLIGTSVPFYVVLHLNQFGELADMLGGMKVFVPSPVDVAAEDGQRWLLPSGSVTLDGDKINTYLTYEMQDETEEEVQDRRQNVMVAFLSALSRNTDTMFTGRSFALYERRMEANLRGRNLERLMSEISGIDAERIVPQAITGSKRFVDGKTLLFPFYDGQLIKDVVRQTTAALVSMDGDAVNRVYVLEIQNGTPVQGLARNTSILMQGAGYDVLTATNADRNDYEKTVIINRIGNAEIAKNIGDFIHCTNIVDEDMSQEQNVADTSFSVDFTIILGRDFDGRYVK